MSADKTKIEEELAAVLELAAYFQDEHTKKMPVIVAFRRWRNGILTTEEFLDRLRADDVGKLLSYDPVVPMEGLTILNDYRQAKRAAEAEAQQADDRRGRDKGWVR
jgi:hypothetical protein